MSRVLVIAEHDGARLAATTAKCVSCALAIGADAIDVVVLGADVGAIAAEAARLSGVTGIVLLEDPAYSPAIAAVWAPELAKLAEPYSHLLGPSTTFGKDLMPRLAALLGVGQISDVMAVDGPYRFRRPIYAGNAIETIAASPDRKLVATVRPASFPADESAAGADAAPIDHRQSRVDAPAHTRFRELRVGRQSGPDLQTAARVVSGGRALGSRENFALIEQLADTLGAAIGASRAAVDSGFAPNDLQVGQTGKIIAPDLYIAIGISGAIQHMTGIKDARTIVAINKDESAPIFEAADIGLVADLFAAVPELIDALRARRQ